MSVVPYNIPKLLAVVGVEAEVGLLRPVSAVSDIRKLRPQV